MKLHNEDCIVQMQKMIDEGVENIADISVDSRCNDMLRICPGISFKSSNSGQSKITTPRQAQDMGADYVIIGRSITKAKDPVQTITSINKTLL